MIVDLINILFEKNLDKIRKIYIPLALNSNGVIKIEGIFLFLEKNFRDLLFLYVNDPSLLLNENQEVFNSETLKLLSYYNIYFIKIILKNIKKPIEINEQKFLLAFFEDNYHIAITYSLAGINNKSYFEKKILENIENFIFFMKENFYL